MRVSPIIGRASGAKTYADFVAHITALATNGEAGWGNNAKKFPGGYTTTASVALFTDMTGTIWMSVAHAYIPPGRAVRHGLPSAAACDQQVANGWKVFFRLASVPDQHSFTGITRNGYSSRSDYYDDPAEPAMTCSEMLYWDGTSAWKMNPLAGTGPTPYTW